MQRPGTRPLVAALLVALTCVLWAPAAEAHTAFESSDPADGAVVDTPVDRIAITFTGEATEAGEGFVVRTPRGEVIEPAATRSEDGRTFTLVLQPPLVDGDVGVRWTVRAADAHPIEGSFRFTTTAPAPPPTPVPTPTVIPTATVIPTPTARVAPTPTPRPTAGPAATPAAAAPIATTARIDPTPTSTPSVQPTADPADSSDEELASPVSIDEFLDVDGGFDAGRPFGWVGRPLSVIGTLMVLGLLAFHRLTLRMPVGAIARLRTVLAVSGAALALGAVAEGLWHVIGDAEAGLGSTAGAATSLRLIGALTIVAVPIALRGASPVRSIVFAVAALLILGSWAFDGHTVSEGNRLMTSAAAIVHVGAGAVWAGGVVGLLLLRREHPEALPGWVARFSVVASVAVAAVGLAGLALTVTILDTFGDLWSTTWGRVLLAKVALVAVAAAGGAYNHFVVVPQIASGQAPPDRLWSVLRTEAAALFGVALLTAALVASSTV